MENLFVDYHKAIDYLEGFINLPIQGDYMIDKHHADVYIKRVAYFLSLLANPQDGFKFIHVAGTSGKGTVTNKLHDVLVLDGKKVGSFTSPFTTTSIEKIKIGDKLIDPKMFVEIVEYLKPYIDQAYLEGPYGRPSYFEIFLAIALIAFKKSGCEWVVLEVGLGGRFDATNIIKNPVITAITLIDYDHTELLGKTLEKIALDKAGIIKNGSIFFTTEKREKILNIFKKICAEQGASFHPIKTSGDHREKNNLLVRSIAREIGIKETSIEKGLNLSSLPCRFEIVQKNPFVVLDGAHNRSKITSTIENLKNLDFNKLTIIIGISNNKDHLSIIRQIVPLAHRVFFTRFQNKMRTTAHPKKLFAIGKKYIRKGSSAEIMLDPNMALNKALKISGENDAILITGSFFLTGELRTRWIPEDYILKHKKYSKK